MTDLYLLALAVEQGGVMVTFHQGTPLAAVRNASPEALLVV